MLVRSAVDARLAVRLPRRSGRCDVVRASTLPQQPDQGPDPAARASATSGRETGGLHVVVRPARSSPVRDPGDDGGRPSRTPEGPVVHLGDGSGPGRRRRVDLCLPGGSARCEEQSAVGRGEMRTAEKSVGGRRNTVGGKPGSARAGCGSAREPSRGRGHPGKESDRSRRARGGAGDGVQRLAAVVALWSAGRSRRPAGGWPGRSPGPVGGRVPPRPGQSRRRREGPCRPTGGPRGPLWPAGGLRRPC